MTLSDQEIIQELMDKLTEHDKCLRRHRRRTEEVWDRLQDDIEKLSSTYQRLQRWRELRRLFEPHMEKIALRCEDVRRAGTKGQFLTEMDIQTLRRALDEYQNLVVDLTAYLEATRTERTGHSSLPTDQNIESGLDELIQWAGETEKDWHDRCQKIRTSLNRSDVGEAADELGNFWIQVKHFSSNINTRIETHAKEIGATAGSLQQEARKVARKVRAGKNEP